MAGAFPGVGQHYGDTSIAEDVTDIIYQITPEDTPFFTMTGDTTAAAPLHQWQTRSINTRQHNANAEGFVYSFGTANQRPTRQSNWTQIYNKDVRVSETLQATEQYAISDQFADQMQVSMVGIKTDKEHGLIQGTLVTGATTTTVRQHNGILQMIIDNSNTYTKIGDTVELSEDAFNDHIQSAWDLGGEPRDVLVGGKLKRKISAFTAANTKFIPADEQRLVNTISMYESDFFPVSTHLSRDIPNPASSGYGLLFIDRTMVRKAWLRRVSARRTPDVADSIDGILKCELTLESGNSDAHFYAANYSA